VCPRAAITEFTPVSKSELGLMLVSLRQRADTIIEKIERCSMQQPTQGEKTKIRFGE
jgi:hypothetical protein